MLKICSLTSGSSGNCLLLETTSTILLVDVGIPFSKLKGYLGETTKEIAVLITHCHSDHISGLKQLYLSGYRVRVYAHEACRLPFGSEVEINRFLNDFTIDSIKVSPFQISHDVHCCCFRLEHNGFVVSVLSDCGTIYEDSLEILADCDLLFVEANYDTKMLYNGRYPPYLKRRIASDRGHLSNEDCGEICRFVAQKGRVKKIVLCHLSLENNLPSLALSTVNRYLQGYNIAVEVAPRLKRLEIKYEYSFA